MTPYQRGVLALKLKDMWAKRARENQVEGGKIRQGCQNSDKPIQPIDTKRELASIAGVSHDTIARIDYLSQKADEDTKEARDKRIFDLWMQCYTLEEIGEREGVHKDTVDETCRNMAELPESDKPFASHLVDFEVPKQKPRPARGRPGRWRQRRDRS